VVSDCPRHADHLPSSVPVVTLLLLRGDGGFSDGRIETDFGESKTSDGRGFWGISAEVRAVLRFGGL